MSGLREKAAQSSSVVSRYLNTCMRLKVERNVVKLKEKLAALGESFLTYEDAHYAYLDEIEAEGLGDDVRVPVIDRHAAKESDYKEKVDAILEWLSDNGEDSFTRHDSPVVSCINSYSSGCILP